MFFQLSVYMYTGLDKLHYARFLCFLELSIGTEIKSQAPVVQRPDNFIQWISHYLTVSICAKISVFPCVQANMHTLTTAKFGSV